MIWFVTSKQGRPKFAAPPPHPHTSFLSNQAIITKFMTRSSIKTFQPPIKGTPAWLVPLIKGPLTNIITKNFELQKILGKIPGAP